jgi:hypothetical protein
MHKATPCTRRPFAINPYITFSNPGRDGVANFIIKLPLDLLHVKTAHESVKALPQQSSFWIRLTEPLVDGLPQLSGFELIWKCTNWPQRPPDEQVQVVLSMETAKVEKCVCGGASSYSCTWADSVKVLHEYICTAFACVNFLTTHPPTFILFSL